MALIKCPECGKEVSDSVYKCPNCGFMLKKPKRGIFGKIFYFTFMFVNVVFLLALVAYAIGIFNLDTKTADDVAAQTAAGAIGIGTIIFSWVMFAVPFGILSYITRPKID